MEMKIFLKNADEAIAFVKKMDAYDYDINLKYDSCIIDAKSIVGVCTLALDKEVTVDARIEGVDRKLEEELKGYCPGRE